MKTKFDTFSFDNKVRLLLTIQPLFENTRSHGTEVDITSVVQMTNRFDDVANRFTSDEPFI